MMAISSLLFSFVILAVSSLFVLSWKASVSRQPIRMSSEYNDNIISVTDLSKNGVNRAMQATAAVVSAFSMASAANAYGRCHKLRRYQ